MRKDLKAKNTMKSNDKCAKILTMYLKSKGLDLAYEKYDIETLDKVLGKFWFEVRQANKKYYRVQSLHHIRYGINRLLKEKGREFDIISDPHFV